MALPDPTAGIAVVIATRNRRTGLLPVIERLTRLPEDPEIVVVDNASDDGTALAVARRFPEVRVIALDRNLGAAARTVGAASVRAPWIAFSDDDSWWEPGSLSRAASLFRKHPTLGVLAARVLVGPQGDLDPTCRAMDQSPLPVIDDLPGPQVLGFVACGAVVRRAAYLQIGGFEPRFVMGAEETMLAIDMAAAGWRTVYVASVTARHHPSPMRNAPARRRRVLRNDLWTAWLRRPLPSAVRKTGELVTAALREPSLLPALAGAAAGLPWVVRHRRPVPGRIERNLRLLERGR